VSQDPRVRLLAACLLVLALLAGCGTAGEETAKPQKKPNDDPSRGLAEDRASEEVAPSRCPAGVAECRETEGRIVYVEEVDPDGDGDAHFVIADSQSITLPGLTAIDVRKGLRPQPLPGPGDLISAAGPVQTGSYGQSQIHALELHVAE
jgi:hypothetical protein